MAKHRESDEERLDRQSSEMEQAELKDREEAIRQIADKLKYAVKSAHRLLVEIANEFKGLRLEAMWNNEWPMIESAVNAIAEIEEQTEGGLP